MAIRASYIMSSSATLDAKDGFWWCRYTETARDPGQTPQQLFARLKATTQKGANRMQRIEGILRVIAQDSHSPARVQTAEDSVAKLSAQLIELQQSEAALEGQVTTLWPCLETL